MVFFVDHGCVVALDDCSIGQVDSLVDDIVDLDIDNLFDNMTVGYNGIAMGKVVVVDNLDNRNFVDIAVVGDCNVLDL